MKDLSKENCAERENGVSCAECVKDVGCAECEKVAEINATDIKAASARVEMPLLAAEECAKSFNEVARGYTCEQAVAEAKRCLN